MLASAAGGGVLTMATCVGKFFTKWGHYPLFVDGALSSLNYSASFIIMQLCGFTLATKQPSLTAAALAGTIRETKGDNRLTDLVTMIARISRSQFAAACGNIGAVIPAVLVFSFVWRQTIGHDFLPAEAARATIESLDPLHSATIPYAALTGIFLWLSSLGAGWVSNWVAYRRLPEAIEHHRSSRAIGSDRMRRLARFVDHHVSGIGGSVTLGVLLGMTPVLGKFFGLPLDVRHVTLSTGSLTLSIVSLGPSALATGSVQRAMAGIILIGLLNFGVSFALALAVAFRAREVSQMERLRLFGAVVRRFFRSPTEFFFPPRNGSRPPTAAAHH
jgi:site-specific recombinase